jgi:hypothetical protein
MSLVCSLLFFSLCFAFFSVVAKKEATLWGWRSCHPLELLALVSFEPRARAGTVRLHQA